jgi:hypothetical protein
MLNRCRKKCEEMGLSNVLYGPGGFLTYEHEAEPADTMVSIAAIASSAGFLEIGRSYESSRDVKSGRGVLSL